ncbi:hypothetical protein EYZ11_007556 [Aspergillus tanneri]|uniref:Uncharacterized protein n=1 Tax=Aspergillus tanneri TaxID=1220188 RepID=A0A4S3JD39_9EURO|nr:hypothetical protein EYZ11_007556 [Aspergillus tanneri]
MDHPQHGLHGQDCLGLGSKSQNRSMVQLPCLRYHSGGERGGEGRCENANANEIPFLAVSGSHGNTAGLGDIQHGIQIWLDKLDSVVIADNGQTNAFGGGVRSKK